MTLNDDALRVRPNRDLNRVGAPNETPAATDHRGRCCRMAVECDPDMAAAEGGVVVPAREARVGNTYSSWQYVCFWGATDTSSIGVVGSSESAAWGW